MNNHNLWRVTIDTNPDDCNLSCIMCEDHSPYSNTQKDRIRNRLPKRRMPFELVEKIFAEAKALGVKEIIPSTMGEPLIYSHFERIIALCHQHQLKLNLTTNGTFPKKGVDEWAKLIIPIGSDVKISWNGATKATQEKIMLKTKWEKVLSNLKTFIRIRDEIAAAGGNYCSVTLQLTFMEENLNELDQIVELGISLGVDRIKGHQLWTHNFPMLQKQSLRKDSEAIARWNIAVEKAQALSKRQALPNGKYIKLVNFDHLEDSAVNNLSPSGICPFLGKEAWIASDGRFNPCCAPEKERRALGDFGNLNVNSLNEIFNCDAYKQLCQNYMQHSVCQKCNMRQVPVV